MKSARELAYRYDLYIVPHWRESSDRVVMEQVEVPPTGSVLEINCGTGGLAIELAVKIGDHGDVVATDADAERLGLARAKTSVKKLRNVRFLERSPADLGMEDYAFELVIGDATLMRPEQVEPLLAEMSRLGQDEATVALTMLTRGSFGEVYSLLWEALYYCQLTGYTHHVEALINQYPTITEAQEMMRRRGLRRVRDVTERRELNFASGQEFFESPLVEDYFLEHWLEFLPDAAARQGIIDEMIKIINGESRGSYYEISVKTSLLLGRK